MEWILTGSASNPQNVSYLIITMIVQSLPHLKMQHVYYFLTRVQHLGKQSLIYGKKLEDKSFFTLSRL